MRSPIGKEQFGEPHQAASNTMEILRKIEIKKNISLKILHQTIDDGIRQNINATRAEEPELERAIEDLMAQSSRLNEQAYEGELGSAEMQTVLRRLNEATDEMNEIAQRMKTTTGFIANAADLLDAADKVFGAISG